MADTKRDEHDKALARGIAASGRSLITSIDAQGLENYERLVALGIIGCQTPPLGVRILEP